MNQSSAKVLVWWAALGAVAVANVCAYALVARRLRREGAARGSGLLPGERWQLRLSGIFVLACAYRSILPRAEGQRICFVDSWISAALFSRSVATVAELCFVAQWCLVMRRYARTSGAPFAAAVSWLPVPMIGVAELFSWYTTLTTNFLGSVVEESIWATTSALLAVGFIALWRSNGGARRSFIAFAVAIHVAYMLFMINVDVPMYWSRWKTGQVQGQHYLSLADGWTDAWRRRVVTWRWEDWRHEVPWMSLYFSAGVWISIGLIRAWRLARSPHRA